MNLIGEGVDAARRRLGIEVPERTVPRRAKIGVAVAVVLLSALVGFPVFELISPIGAVNKGLVFGGFAGAGTLLAIIIAELLVSRRLWCRALCPLGGTFQVLGRAGQVNVAIDHDACIHCDKCTHVCLADPEILAPALAGRIRSCVPATAWPVAPAWTCAPLPPCASALGAPPFPKGYRKRIGEKSQRR